MSNGATSTQPSPTLFVQNLDDKLKKEDLKRVLYQLFATHGKVLDVVVMKGKKMRGTAHVVYKDLQGATQAMRWLDGSGLLGREMRIAYARSRSHATIRHEAGDDVLYQVKVGIKDPETLQDVDAQGQARGTGRMVVSGAQASNIEKRKADEAAAKKRAREEESESESESDDGSGPRDPKKSKANGGAGNDEEEAMEEESDDDEPTTAAAAAVAAAGSAPIAPGEVPGPVLFLEGLPGEVTDDMMNVLFSQYPGFQSVKMVPGRTGIAFVQYDTTSQSETARLALDGFQLAPGVLMKVGFARKG